MMGTKYDTPCVVAADIIVCIASEIATLKIPTAQLFHTFAALFISCQVVSRVDNLTRSN
jgi:hypothetical protein